jgi:hypothetical protein
VLLGRAHGQACRIEGQAAVDADQASALPFTGGLPATLREYLEVWCADLLCQLTADERASVISIAHCGRRRAMAVTTAAEQRRSLRLSCLQDLPAEFG